MSDETYVFVGIHHHRDGIDVRVFADAHDASAWRLEMTEADEIDDESFDSWFEVRDARLEPCGSKEG